MKLILTGLDKKYTSGQVVNCSITIVPIRGVDVTSSSVYLVKRISSPNGNTDIIISRDQNNNILDKYSKAVPFRFFIPRDSTNSSNECGIRVQYGVYVKLYSRNEFLLSRFFPFKNTKFVHVTSPKYLYSKDHINNIFRQGFRDNSISLMYKAMSSTFYPGEIVKFRIIIINKTLSKISSVKVSLYREQWKISSKKCGFFIKTLPDNNLNVVNEYAFMRETLDSGVGDEFCFKLPSTLSSEENMTMNIRFVVYMFGNRWEMSNTIKIY